MDKKFNTIIALKKEAEDALVAIEKRYGLEESDDEAVKIIDKGGIFKINMVADLAKRLFTKELSQEQFVILSQKQLGLDKQTSEKLLNDVTKNIIPFTEKISEEDVDKKDANIATEQKKSIVTGRPMPTQEKKILSSPSIQENITQNNKTEPAPIKNSTTKKAVREIKKQVSEKPIQPQAPSSGPDKYRENI